jgi:serine/threonine protein kinase
LESIHKYLVDKCDCANLKLCRLFLADDPLAHGLVGGPVNHFVAHTLIQHADADVKRVKAGVIGATTRVTFSPYACQGHPIQVANQLTRDGRVMRGKVTLLRQDIPVVIKIGNSIEDLTREVVMLRRVQGEGSHAPEILDAAFGMTGTVGGPYLVMRSFGVNLTHFLSMKKSTNECRLTIAIEIIEALIWLHGREIVHCDIKPENILVLDEGGGHYQAILCDFESATGVGDPFPSGAEVGAGAGEQVLRFTKHWVSPEVYLHNRLLQTNSANAMTERLSVTKAMDVFPMGLVLGCLFDRERSANMTMLPDDDDQLHTALTQPGLLLERISCNSGVSCRESVASLCALDSADRGRLSDVLGALDGLRRSRLQIHSSSQGAIIAVQGQVIGGLGAGMERVEMNLGVLSSDVRESHDELQSSVNRLSGELAAARLGPAK